MKRKNLLIVFFVILAVAAVVLIKEKSNRVCFKNYCFDVELAKTTAEMSRGLMFRENLAADKGMFFIFKKEGKYPFWMKNTLIPLDIIWINENKEVVFVSENTQPCPEESPCFYINPDKNAEYVLEINGGLAGKIGLKIGDKANLSGFLAE
ncbi:MAG: DUF192 domain-containing protein [bacterium]|nr:DUF192 domain-containing protein [bacterium]